MSNFKLNQLHSLAEADAPPTIFNSPVKLAPPMSPPTEEYSSESSSYSRRDSLDASLTNVHIGADNFLVHFDNKSQTPETLLEQSCGSHIEEQLSELSTSTELPSTPSRPVEGYSVEPLGGEEDVDDRNDTPMGCDSSVAEEDQESCPTANIGQSDKDLQDKERVETHHVLDFDQTTDSERSQFLMSVEQGMHPLHEGEAAPGQFTTNWSRLNNGNVPTAMHHFSSSSTNGGAPFSGHQLAAAVPLAHSAVANNIIWDVPLIDEITEESRTVPAASETRHRSHD